MAETRSFERCAPTSPRHDCPRALAPPLRAHGPLTAHIFALGHYHGRTVWGGCTGGGLACRSLTIHTHYTIPHKWVVHFRLRHSHVHPPRQVSMTLKLSQLRAKLESGIEFYDGAFFLEFLEHINLTVSRSGAPLLRSPPRTLSSLPHFACAVHPALSPRVCAGSKAVQAKARGYMEVRVGGSKEACT